MSPAIIIIALLFFTSAIMTVALGIAWLHFGRRSHVLSWMLSYCAAMVQWVANAGGIVTGSRVLMALAACCIVISGTLVAAGVRQRANRPVRWLWLGAIGLMIAAGGCYAAWVENKALVGMIVPGYVGILMLVSAVSLWPRNRRFSAPEAALFGMFALSRIPRLTMTVGYDPRFSHGDFGVWVAAGPDRAPEASELLRRHGALEVRNER